METPIRQPSRAPETLRDEERSRLAALARELRLESARVRRVGYREAEADAERLAAALVERLGRRELAEAAFAPIPRGGLLVLGLLSYCLDLDRARLAAPPDPTRPLILVDDCALSGFRLGEALERHPSPRVVFAHLYSPEPLRQAIAAQEPRVEACLAARDLALAPASPTDGDRSTAKRLARLAGKRYWAGRTELVCLPWTEPDHLFWNPVTERLETGWRFVPPDRCLKNRADLGLPPAAPGQRRWRCPEDLVHGAFDGVLWLCPARTEEVFRLEGVGADLWRGLAAYGELEPALRALETAYDVEPDRLRRDAEGFVAELLALGVLEEA